MNIAYAADDNFADIMAVSIASLLENNRGAGELDIYVLDNQISDANQDKLARLVSSYRRGLHILPMPDMHALAGVKILPERVPLSAFSRLFLPLVLPEAVGRVLYLDCDTIVRGPLAGFYHESMDGFLAAGVLDCVSKGHRKNIGLGGDDGYFNSGVLLIDLGAWRENAVCGKLISFIASRGGNVPYEDQGTLNGVLGRDMRAVSPAFNSMTVGFDFPTYEELCRYRRPGKYYTEREYHEAVTAPVIVHFSQSFLSLRPWVEGCRHPYAGEWLHYKALTPWKDKPPRRDNRSRLRRLSVRTYRALPAPAAISVAGWLHATAVPWLRDLKAVSTGQNTVK